jgi:tetratricopeptide (TPR) repeat protein
LLILFPEPRARYFRRYLGIRLVAYEGAAEQSSNDLESWLDSMNRHSSGANFTERLFVDVRVSAGKYRAAVLGGRHVRLARLRTRKLRGLRAIWHINRAEALHNLGRDDLALRLLDRSKAASEGNPVARNGLLCLRAWILGHRGEVAAARRAFTGIDPKPLSPMYLPEVLFTKAALELASGDVEGAFTSATAGLGAALRASSERNGLFLLGKIERVRGNLEQAVEYYERGRSHRYRGQGGGSLCELGELYQELGRTELARAAFVTAIERDPESAAAAQCRMRLEQAEPVISAS